MKTLVLAALMLTAVPAAAPDIPRVEDRLKQEILAATIVDRDAKTYVCGTAFKEEETRVIRFVVLLSRKIDWQIWEPSFTDRTWKGWNDTYFDICGDY